MAAFVGAHDCACHSAERFHFVNGSIHDNETAILPIRFQIAAPEGKRFLTCVVLPTFANETCNQRTYM